MIINDVEVLVHYETIDGSGAMLSQMFTYDCRKCDYFHAKSSRLLSEIVLQIAEHVLTQEHQEK